MSNNLLKNDFIEIEFTGRDKEGNIFDSNIKKDLEKLPNSKSNQAKPFIFALGQGMFMQSVDEYLMKNSEIGKEYKIDLEPEKAFGVRQSKFVQLMPMKIFHEQKINPVQGAMFNFDGRIAKILSVSGGRVMVDFNHPLAGKPISYEIKVIRKLEDITEKTKSFIDFLFRKPLEFKIDEKSKKVTITLKDDEKQMKQFIEMFAEKFKEVLDLELSIKEIIPDKTKDTKNEP